MQISSSLEKKIKDFISNCEGEKKQDLIEALHIMIASLYFQLGTSDWEEKLRDNTETSILVIQASLDEIKGDLNDN